MKAENKIRKRALRKIMFENTKKKQTNFALMFFYTNKVDRLKYDAFGKKIELFKNKKHFLPTFLTFSSLYLVAFHKVNNVSIKFNFPITF